MDPFEGSLKDPLSLHRFVYGNNNPVNNVDPSGLFTLVGLMAAVGIQSILISQAQPAAADPYGLGEATPTFQQGRRLAERAEGSARLLTFVAVSNLLQDDVAYQKWFDHFQTPDLENSAAQRRHRVTENFMKILSALHAGNINYREGTNAGCNPPGKTYAAYATTPSNPPEIFLCDPFNSEHIGSKAGMFVAQGGGPNP